MFVPRVPFLPPLSSVSRLRGNALNARSVRIGGRSVTSLLSAFFALLGQFISLSECFDYHFDYQL